MSSVQVFSGQSLCYPLTIRKGLFWLFVVSLFLSFLAIFETFSRRNRSLSNCSSHDRGLVVFDAEQEYTRKRKTFQKNCSFITGDNKLVPRRLELHGSGKFGPFPKTLHRMWRRVADDWTDASSSCRKNNLEYQFCTWTDGELEELISVEYPSFLSTYRTYRLHEQRDNVARYIIINRFGGIFIDLPCLDFQLPFNRFLTNFTEFDVILAETPSGDDGGLLNSFMISKPRQPFWKHVVGNLRDSNRWYGLPRTTAKHSTGVAYLANCHLSYAGDRSRSTRISVIPTGVIRSAIPDHLEESSWHYDAVFLKHCYLWRIPIFLLAISSMSVLLTLITISEDARMI